VQGCSSTVGIQADHRVPWADDQVTELANLDPHTAGSGRPTPRALDGAKPAGVTDVGLGRCEAWLEAAVERPA
jgi:hypothetical protein